MKIKRYITIILIIGGLLTGTAAGVWLSRNAKLFSASNTEPIRNLSNASKGAEPANSKGAEGAPVTLEEFGDFQCPPCANLHEEIKKLEGRYGVRVRLVFRHFPLESHDYAFEAAQASEAAARQGKFWEMHDLLYERQKDWSENNNVREAFSNYAKILNLDAEKFLRDMDSAEVKARIQSDKERGDSVDISGTPTLFINGSEVPPDSMSPEGIQKLIEEALR